MTLIKYCFLIAGPFLFCASVQAESGVMVSTQSCVNLAATDKDLERANDLSRKKQYAEALATYQKVSENCKNTARFYDVQVAIGETLIRRHKNSDARKEYEKVLTSDSGKQHRAKAIDGIFFSYLQDNDFKKAEAFYIENAKTLGYSGESLERAVKQKQEVSARWQKDLPEKQKIFAIIENYNKMLVEKNVSELKPMFVKAIADARAKALASYIQKNPSENRSIDSVEIYISDSGKSATAEFQVYITKRSEAQALRQVRDAFFKFQREDGQWKISE